MNDKLLEKIKKLLAMADPTNGATEHEVSAATLLANRLLQDNGLSLAQVQASGQKTDDKREQSNTDRRAHYKWQRELMSMLADVNFCWHSVIKQKARDRFQRPGPDGEHPWRISSIHILIGRPINISVTVSLYDYLSTAITREAKDRNYVHGTKDNNAFFEGAVSRLAERLRDQKAKREREQEEARRKAGSANALVVLSDVYASEEDANTDFRNGWKPGTSALRRQQRMAEQRALDAKFEELKTTEKDWVVAWYLSRGYSREDAERYAKAYHKREERTSKRFFRHIDRKGAAFYDGRSAAENIGLDQQLENESSLRIG